MNKEFQNRLAEKRQEAKLTQLKLAVMSGVSTATISRLETVGGAVSLQTAFKLAAALNLPIGDLFPAFFERPPVKINRIVPVGKTVQL